MIIDSPIISGSYAATGSLNQVGNVVITGSLTVTEQITGSINSASFAQNAATASYLSNYIPPFPYTGSAGISGSLSVNGDITSSGTIVAQTLYVQTITSSVDFVTGSTRFGSELSNTHLFTGSVTITGSLAVNGSTAVLTNQTGAMSVATASYVANAVSSSFAQTAISASYASNVPATASFAVSASQAENATSASYITGSNVIGTVASATSASFAQTAISASYASNVPATASFAVSASQAQNAVSAAYSAYALTSSYSLAGSGFPFSGSAVITGSLLITNLSSSGVSYLVADSTGFITAQTASAAIKTTQTFTASAGQTTFTITNGYTTGLVDVFVNGTKLNSSEFTDTNGTTIVLATGSFVDDIVEFSKYLPASGVTNNTLRQLTTFTASAGQTVFSASYTPGLLDIYYNGSHLSNGDFTANNGTFITLATGSAEGDILDVFVYTYQVGAFSGIGGEGVANEISYFNTTNSITSSAAITISGTNAIITGSLLGTASYAANANLLDGLDSSVFVPTGSFNTFSSSILTYTGSADSRFSALETTSGSNITRIAALEVTSGSNITRISALETASGSAITRLSSIESTTGSLNAASGSAITRLSSLESKTGSYATTGSNIFVEGQYLSSSYNPTGFSTTASLYTDGGLRVTRDAYISGTLYLNNVTVFGTQSVCFITSSQLNISSNLISVNTATPSVRFGGLAVYDSGSTGLTGSLLWDSQNNHWIYSNPSGSSYSGGMFISGPRTAALGSETGTTSCMLLAGQGGDHLTSSMIYHSSTATCIPNTLIGSTVCSTMINASCIGIGTTTPGDKLEVGGLGTNEGILIKSPSSQPRLQFYAGGASADNRTWDFIPQSSGILVGRALNDAGSVAGTWISVTRSGSTITSVAFPNGSVGIGTVTPSSPLSICSTFSSSTPMICITGTGTGTYQRVITALNPGMAAGDDLMISMGTGFSCRNMGQIYFHSDEWGCASNRMSIGLYQVDNVLNVMGSGIVQIGYTGVPASTGKLFISRGDQYGLNLNAQSGYARIQADDDLLAINRGGVDILSMSTCNHLGVRTTASPWAALRVCQCTSNADYAVRVQAVFGINDYLDSDANRIFGGGLSETQFLNGSSTRPAMISLGGNLATSEALGVINFFRSDNASTYRSRAQIWAATNGSGCSTTLGGYITFTTADTGQTNPTQKVTIASTGNTTFACKIGVAGASATYPLTVYNGSNGTTAAFGGTVYGIRIDNGGTFSSGRSTIYGVDSSFYGSYQPLAIGGSEIYFNISGTDKVSINSSNLVVQGSGLGLQFTGGNNRIYFGACRAIEGNTSGTTLQIGEGYDKTQIQSSAQMYNGSAGNSPKLYFGSEGNETAGAKAIYLETYWMVIQPHTNEGLRIRAVNSSGTQYTIAKFYGTGTFSLDQYSNGTLSVSGGVVVSSSDKCMKIDDGGIDTALPKIMCLNPRYFYWKPETCLNSCDRQLGFYAQDVSTVLGTEVANQSHNCSWGIYDRGIIAMLTKGMQEQQCTINILKTCLGIS